MFTSFLLALAIVMCLVLAGLLVAGRAGGPNPPVQAVGVAVTAAALVALGVFLL